MTEINGLISKAEGFKLKTTKSIVGDLIANTEELQDFIAELPSSLKEVGIRKDDIERVVEIAKFVPGNPPFKLNQLIEVLNEFR
ncbi:hypothetical protein ACQKMD_01280 [Viridibacillus sp. NPDC096237]|uniref:hypothetical protein n=1 Tax=Viridibacillus sp. NPDC096237 TaxID=3390721 RepID=UPI003CFEE5C1